MKLNTNPSILDHTNYRRKDGDQPLAVIEWGWKYHHIGIPTDSPIPGSRFLSTMKFSVEGFDHSPFGVEWMYFENDSPIHPLIQSVPHVAFEVDDLDQELGRRDFNILSHPGEPSNGIRVAMIEHNGAPIELIEFR